MPTGHNLSFDQSGGNPFSPCTNESPYKDAVTETEIMYPSFLLKFSTLILPDEFSIEHDWASDLDGLLYSLMLYTKWRGIDASKLLYYIERHYYASSLEAERAAWCKWWLVELVFLVAFLA